MDCVTTARTASSVLKRPPANTSAKWWRFSEKSVASCIRAGPVGLTSEILMRAAGRGRPDIMALGIKSKDRGLDRDRGEQTGWLIAADNATEMARVL